MKSTFLKFSILLGLLLFASFISTAHAETITGEISCDGFTADTGGIYIDVYTYNIDNSTTLIHDGSDSPLIVNGTDPVPYTAVIDSGDLGVTQLVLIDVYWDADKNESRSIFDYFGEKAASLLNGYTGHNLVLYQLPATTLSGTISCGSFENNNGKLYIGVFDAPQNDPEFEFSVDTFIGSTALPLDVTNSDPIDYTAIVMSKYVGDPVWIYSFWDATDNGISYPPDTGDFWGEYDGNPYTLTDDNNTDINFTLFIVNDNGTEPIDNNTDFDIPEAIAGLDFTAIAGTATTLDGSFSEPLSGSFEWTLTSPQSVSLDNSTSVTPSFTPIDNGTYSFELTVTSDNETSRPDDINVIVVDSGTEEASIVEFYASFNAALQNFIDNNTSENLDTIMDFFSDQFFDDGTDKTTMRDEFEEVLMFAEMMQFYVSDIRISGTEPNLKARCFQTILMEFPEFPGDGETEMEIEFWPIRLAKEAEGWKVYGNQREYEVRLGLRSFVDGTYGVYAIAEDLDNGTSINVTGPGIDGSLTLMDDGLNNDDDSKDGVYAGFTFLSVLPAIEDDYTVSIGNTTIIVQANDVMENFVDNGSATDGMYPDFYWDIADGAAFYVIKIIDPDDNETIWDEETPFPFIEYDGPMLTGGKTYMWQVLAFNVFGNAAVSDTFFFVPEGESPTDEVSISGDLYCDFCEPGMGLFSIGVYDGSDPFTSIYLGGTYATAAGPYEVDGLPSDTEIWVHAQWFDIDNSTYSGSYPGNPLYLYGTFTTGINITVSEGGSGSGGSLSGQIYCDECDAGGVSGGMIYVEAYDGPDPYTSMWLGNTYLDAPGPYDIHDLPLGTPIYVFASYYGYDESYFGEFPTNPVILSEDGMFDIDITLTSDEDSDLPYSDGTVLDEGYYIYIANEGKGGGGTTIFQMDRYGYGYEIGSFFNGPSGLAIHPVTGDLYVSDDNNGIYQVLSDGSLENIKDTLDLTTEFQNPNALAFDDQNRLLVAEAGDSIKRITLDPDNATVELLAQGFQIPQGVAAFGTDVFFTDNTGYIYQITDNHTLPVSPSDNSTYYTDEPVVSGTQGGLVIDSEGTIYAADYFGSVIKITDNGTETIFDMQGYSTRGLCLNPNEDTLLVTAYDSDMILEIDLDTDNASILSDAWMTSGMLNGPFGMVITDTMFSYFEGEGGGGWQPLAPVAITGPDFTAVANGTVDLNGSYSEPSGGIFEWTVTSSQSITLSESTTERPYFTPMDNGTYTFQLVVNNGYEDSNPDEIVVTIVDNGTEEASIVETYNMFNEAAQQYIDNQTETNLDVLMSFFSDQFIHDGENKDSMRYKFADQLNFSNVFNIFVNDIQVSGTDPDLEATCIQTFFIQMVNEWGEPFIEFENMYMNLVKEAEGWKIFGNQASFDLWANVILRNNGDYGLNIGLVGNDIISVTVSGPGIDDNTTSLYDDGMHHDNDFQDDMWGNKIPLTEEPEIGDEYVFNILTANDNATEILEISGIMTAVADNGTTSDGMPPAFFWESADDASGYAIKVFDEWGYIVWENWGIPSNFIDYTGPPLYAGDQYQWVVLAFDEFGNISESDIFSFTPTGGGGDGGGGDKVITGRIMDSNGDPIQDVWVNAWSDSVMYGMGEVTDDNGTYRISHLMQATDYRIEVWDDNYSHQFFQLDDNCTLPDAVDDTVDYSACGIDPTGTSDWGMATLVDLYAYDASGIDFILSAGVTISGTVTGADGTPLQDVFVSAWSESTNAWGGEPTDDNGTYTLRNLREGTDYRVEIQDENYAHQFFKVDDNCTIPEPVDNIVDYSTCGIDPVGTCMWEEVTLVTTNETALAQGVNFIVQEGKSISGLVLVNGQPVTNTWVNAHSENLMSGNGSETNENGEYTINGLLPSDDYRVDIWHPEYTYQIYNNQTDWQLADLVDITEEDAININFNLSAGKSISGNVSDENGYGISGVWVNAHSEELMFGKGEMTDANGDYVISGMAEANDYRVDIWVEGYVGQFYDHQTDWMEADLVDITSEDATDIDFSLSAGVYIEGTITLADNGTDFSMIWVNAHSENSMFGNGTPVNEDGTYRITGLTPATDYRVEIHSDQYQHLFYNGQTDWMMADLVDITGGSVSNIDFSLSDGVYIEGRIYLPDNGTDYSNIWVNAHSESSMIGSGTHVDDDGTYRIRGLGQAYDYKVDVFSDYYQNQFYDNQTDWMDADPVSTLGGSVSNINFTLSSGTAISGRVTDSGGEGVGNIWVDAWSPVGSWGGNMTDEDGYFTINGLVDGAEYHVNIHHPDYASQSSEVTAGSDDASNVSLTLSSGTSISGTVTSGDGSPIAHAWINAWSDSSMVGRGEPTNSNGEYVISGLPASSDYRVDVWKDGYANQFYDGQSFWDQADFVNTTEGDAENIDFVLSTGNVINGTITIPAGSNKNNIWVNAFSESMGGMGAPVEDWTDNDDNSTGSFLIEGLAPGSDYKVDVWSPEYQHVFYKEGNEQGVGDWMEATEVNILSGDATGINITLSTGKTISGTVVISGGGSTANLWVNAWSETEGSFGGSMVEPDGSYEIVGLASASDFRVDIWSDAYGYQIYDGQNNWEDADLVDVSSADAVDIDFNLSTGKTISGRITSPDGDGVSDAWVNVWSERARFGRGEPTDEDGYFSIKGLDSSSDFRLDVWSNEYGNVMYKDEGSGQDNGTTMWDQATLIDVSTDDATNINIAFSEGRSIAGNVSDSGGPIEHAWINAWSPGGGNGASTDSNGDYIIKGLPAADNFKVEVWAEGYVRKFYNNKSDWMDADTVDVSSGNAVDIDFVLGSGNSISGTVTADGSPIRRLWVNAWSETVHCWGGSETDSNGEYTITGLSPADDYVVDVWSDEYAHQFYNQQTDWENADRVDVSSDNATDVDFELSSGNYISGQIILPGDNTDYFRVWINAWSDDTLSGNGSPVHHDGTYKISGLIPGTGYKIDVWSEDFVHAFYKEGATNNSTTDWDNATEIDISSVDVESINITLGAGAGISGRVTFGGEGVAYVWVDAWSPSTGAWGGSETDSEGYFTISGLVSGSDYEVSSWSWEYENTPVTGVSTGTEDVAIVLSTGISISGNLHNDSGGIGGVWIDAWSDAEQVGGWAISDGSGTIGNFTISGLKANTTYTINAATGNHGFISAEVTVESTDVTGVDLHITTGDPISGTVTDSNGDPITDVEVIIAAFDISTDTFYNSTTANSEDGTYELTNLPVDKSFKIVAKAEGYADQYYNGATTYEAASIVTALTTGDIDFSLSSE